MENKLPTDIQKKIDDQVQFCVDMHNHLSPHIAVRAASEVWGDRLWKLRQNYELLQTKYDNILATESGHESKTENVWQSGYAAGHEAATEKYAALRGRAGRMEQALKEIQDFIFDAREKRITQKTIIISIENTIDQALQPQEGENLTCQEANKECDQLDVCQLHGRCLRSD